MEEILYRYDTPFVVVFGLFVSAVLLLWSPLARRCYLPWIFLVAALTAGLFWDFLQPFSLVAVGLFYLCYLVFARYRHQTVLVAVAGFVLLVLGSSLLLHRFPGFDNPVVVEAVALSADSVPYRMYANFDKGLLAFFLVLVLSDPLQQDRGLFLTLKRSVLPTVITVALLIGAAMLLGFVRYDPKWFDFFRVWLPVNLTFVCIAEEAFFRGFLQRCLQDRLLGFRFAGGVALVLASVIFGAAHYQGGLPLIVLSTLAGLGYGWAFLRTGRLEGAIAVHFLLNAVHLMLFSYPALA
ncbi:CPBP family intramembrane glutamic endopeptidase [Kiloniella sp. b19]|uniref:CPBP family intramembrane glutamic endopeptidase n=1 Tax=Kiloniella sp. GXU_MW_B19 TaxID=3141326 RepID=UPI0031CFC305